jgi:hypothetical protein
MIIKYLYIFLIIYCSINLKLNAQGLLNNGGTLAVQSGAYFIVNQGGIINQNNGTIANAGQIHLSNNWLQTGTSTIYSGTGWVYFLGGSNQTITGLNTVDKIKINNDSKLLINNDLTISNQLDLSNNGKVELGNFNLIFLQNTICTNYDASNYIITNSTGSLQRPIDNSNGAVVFPIGNSSYNPLTMSNLGTLDDFSATVNDLVYANGTSGAVLTEGFVNRTWNIEESVAGGSSLNLDFQWNVSDEQANFVRTASRVNHWTGSQWQSDDVFGGASNVGGGNWSQSVSGVSVLSPFIVESTFNPLPLQLLSFEGQRLDNQRVKLSWKTANERNVADFVVERRLENETNFKTIGQLKAQNIAQNSPEYQLWDENLASQISYYRLKMMDKDGQFQYSPLIAINGTENILPEMLVFPNPSQDKATLQLKNITQGQFTYAIFSPKGDLIYQKKHFITPNNEYNLAFVNQIPAGTYLIQVIVNQRFVLNYTWIKVD